MESHDRDISDSHMVSPVMESEHEADHGPIDGRLSPCQSDVSTLASSLPPTRPRWSASVFTALPEVVNFGDGVGKEVDFWPDEKKGFKGYDKIVVEQPSLPEVVFDTESGKEVVEPPASKRSSQQSFLLTPAVWSRKARLIVAGLAVVFLLAIGLGIGLGVGLNPASPSQQAQEVRIGGAVNSAYYSTEGAFNGTGLALTYQNFSSSPGNVTKGTLVLYFQHWTGDIRWMERAPNGSWSGGDQYHLVTNNATNSTSLSAVSYVVDNSSEWHIFFIDKAHRIREGIYSNNTLPSSNKTDLITNDTPYANNSGLWKDGPICNLYANTLVSDQVGLQTCWYDVNDPATVGPDVGLYLWYAPNETTFAQLSWRGGTEVYSYEDSWQDVNGHTSPGCYTWGPGMTTYFMFVDLHGRINFYWKDTSSNMMTSPTHPINQWTNSSLTIPNVGGTASVAYMDVVVAQSETDHMFREYGIDWAAENTTLIERSEAMIGDLPGVPGSRIATTTIPNEEGGQDILVFFQTQGNDVTQFRRRVGSGGLWEKTVLPIPAD